MCLSNHSSHLQPTLSTQQVKQPVTLDVLGEKIDNLSNKMDQVMAR
jgi:hypothetical protein